MRLENIIIHSISTSPTSNINKDNSIIFGSRYEKNAKSYDDDIITRIGNYGFTLMGNLLFSLKITDLLFFKLVTLTELGSGKVLCAAVNAF